MSPSDHHDNGVPGRPTSRASMQDPVPVLARRDAAHDGLALVGETEESSRRLRLSLRAITRFKGTFLLVALLVAAAGTTAVWTTYRPEYSATASLFVSPTQEWVLYPPRGDQRTRSEYLRSQADRVTGTPIVDRVLQHPDVQQTQWFREPERSLLGGERSHHERLRDLVKTSVRPGTTFIDITVVADDSQEAAVIANAFHDVFLSYVKDEIDAQSKRVYEKLTPMEGQLSGNIERQRQSREKAVKELQAPTVEQYLARRGTWLEEWNARLADIELEIEMLKRQQERLADTSQEKGSAASDTPDESSGQVRYQADTEWRERKRRLTETQMQLDDRLNRLGPQHPEVAELQNRIQMYEKELHDWERFLDEQSSRLPLALGPRLDSGTEPFADAETLARQIELKELERARLDERIRKFDDQFRSGLDQAFQLERDTDELQANKETLARVVRRMDELNLEGSLASIESGGKALPPTQPANRLRPFRFTAVALFAGLVLGFLAANWRATKVPAAHEFSKITGAPVLGLLPYVREKKRQVPEELGIQNESIRIVRTSVMHRLDVTRGCTIVVTSAGPRAGKTTVAVMLAKSFAAAGKKVLLVDADLRHPRIAEHMSIRMEPGLAQLLAAETTDAEAITTTDTPHLSVLPGSRVRDGAGAEILGNGVMSTALNRWREKYDLIVLDACPILPVADARILLGDADGVILVAREGRCRSTDLAEAVACVEASGRQLLGTVFVGSRDGQSYRSMYRHYYDGHETA
jgi:succinoglycan biosynthesis transport protein ExoP